VRPRTISSILSFIEKHSLGKFSFDVNDGVILARFEMELDFERARDEIELIPMSTGYVITEYTRYIQWNVFDILVPPKKKLKPYCPGDNVLRDTRRLVTGQEEDAASLIGGKRHVGSGSIQGLKSDASSEHWQLEAKSTRTDSFRLTKKILQKIHDEAKAAGKRPILHLRFRESDSIFTAPRDWVIIPSESFEKMR